MPFVPIAISEICPCTKVPFGVKGQLLRRCSIRSEGFRLPILNYSAAVKEVGYVRRILRWAAFGWLFGRRTSPKSILEIVGKATALRRLLVAKLNGLLGDLEQSAAYQKRRVMTKVRSCAARLIYLASEADLREFGTRMLPHTELAFHSRAMLAVATGELSAVVAMGSNAAQAVAQPLKASGRSASVSGDVLSDSNSQHFRSVCYQSLATFLLNGIPVAREIMQGEVHSDLIRLAKGDVSIDLMAIPSGRRDSSHSSKSDSQFVQELACLIGLERDIDHSKLIETAFDWDERLTMDAVELLQEYESV